MSRTVQNRAYDHIYDPVYTTSASGGGAKYRGGGGGGAQTAAAIQGGNRYKFFRRPLVPFLNSVPAEVMLARAAPAAPEAQAASKREAEVVSATKEVGVQSMYRESEAQTDPYTPNYIVPAGTNPEILGLIDMKYGSGLPAGLHEVQQIERERARRAFEQSLPPMTDEASFELRKKMMAAQEARDWARRDQELEQMNKQRLELLQKALLERDAEAQMLADQRVEALRQAKLEQKDILVSNIQRMRIKNLRKLSNARKAAEDKLRDNRLKRDIIGEYANFSSNVYAPQKRVGKFPDALAPRYDIDAQKSIKSLEGLTDLEQTLPTSLVSMSVKGPRDRRRGPRNTKQRKQDTVKMHLDRMANLIKDKQQGKDGKGDQRVIPAWMKKKEKVVRPPTPSVEQPQEDSRQVRALLCLQKLLRGRAVQNMMYEGKERRRELIRELRYEEELAATASQHQEQKEAEEAEQQFQAAMQSTREKLAGEVVSSTLNFLANQRVMMENERRIAQLATNAENIRAEREAKEAGRRQAEERLRERREVMFQAVFDTHKESADAWTDQFLGDMVEEAAALQAMTDVGVAKETIQPVISGIDAIRPSQDGRRELTNLVASFLQPEFDRTGVQRAVSRRQRRQ